MSYYSIEDERNAILEIQRILRDLDHFNSDQARIRLTGVYDGETRQGVRNFQEKYGLPVTGTVDHTTFQVLQAADLARKEATELARAVYILPRSEEYTIYPQQRDNVVYVLQHMLNVISQEYDGIEPLEFTGIYDEVSVLAIKEFQRRNLIEDNGIIDATTFNRLANEYERINSYSE